MKIGLNKHEDALLLMKLRPEVKQALRNFEELSKKKPNDSVNKFKLKFVNYLFNQANEILLENRFPDKDFRLFDEDELPSNSDVVMMLTQYSNALDRLYNDAEITELHKLVGFIVDGERWEYDRMYGAYLNEEEEECEDDEEFDGNEDETENSVV